MEKEMGKDKEKTRETGMTQRVILIPYRSATRRVRGYCSISIHLSRQRYRETKIGKVNGLGSNQARFISIGQIEKTRDIDLED